MASDKSTTSQKLATGKDKAQKAEATVKFLAKAKIKDFGAKGWYASIPGETPPKHLLFLEEMLHEQ